MILLLTHLYFSICIIQESLAMFLHTSKHKSMPSVGRFLAHIDLCIKLSLMHFDKPSVKYMKKVLKKDKEENNQFHSSKSSCTIMKMSDSEGTEDRYLRGYYIQKEPCRVTIFIADRKQKSMVFAVLSAGDLYFPEFLLQHLSCNPRL